MESESQQPKELITNSLIEHISGIAIDLRTQKIFPASYPWNNFEDFSSQLQDRFLRWQKKNYLSVNLEVWIESSISRRTGQGSTLPDEDKHKTKLSTFKPKALRNPKTFKNLQNAVGKENSQGSPEDLSKKDGFGNPLFGTLKPMVPKTKVSKGLWNTLKAFWILLSGLWRSSSRWGSQKDSEQFETCARKKCTCAHLRTFSIRTHLCSCQICYYFILLRNIKECLQNAWDAQNALALQNIAMVL